MADPFSARIAAGRTDLVHEALAAGLPAGARDADGVPLLRWCAYYGDVGALRCLLERGAAPSDLGENFDLNSAAFHGHWRLCEFLIGLGADPGRELADTGETPLHAALCHPDRTASDLVVELLLAHGADPNHVARDGAPTGCFMRDARTRGETPLHRAAAHGSERAIQALLRAGARREARDARGETPLAWASWHRRQLAVLRLLLYGEHRIHPEARTLAENLLGRPLPDEG